MKSLVIFVLIASLWTSANCVTFNCTFKMDYWSVVGTVYTCYRATVLLSNGTELQKVTGQHESGKSDANVEALHVYNTNCPFIPTKIETFFPNLLVIRFYQTNLKVLTSTDIRPFPMLKMFGAANNLIESMDGDVFDNNIQLEQVYIWSNKLANVGLYLLDKLTKLQVAHFSDNPCIDFYASTPAGIAQLKQKLIDQCPPKATTTTSAPPTTKTTTTSAPTTTKTTTTSAPTCGIIEEFSLCEAEFSYMIDSQVAERTNPLVLKVFGLDQQQIEMQEQVTDNVAQIDELKQEVIKKGELISEIQAQLGEKDERISELEKQIQDILRILEVQQKV